MNDIIHGFSQNALEWLCNSPNPPPVDIVLFGFSISSFPQDF